MQKNDSKELLRLRALYRYEREEYLKGRRLICGIDEAGRGPLAGPVVSSAVILPFLSADEEYAEWYGADDSKKISRKRREALYERVIHCRRSYVGIGIVSEEIIDRDNILRAAQMSMAKAVENLGVRPGCLLIDGMFLPDVSIPQRKIIDGDKKSLSVALASIVAKVVRDGIMRRYHSIFPQYGFDRHKGYGTKEHFRKIKEYGPCRIHRKSFRPIALMREIGYK